MAGIGDIGVSVTADTAQFTSGMDRVAQIAETSMRRAEQAQKIATAASDKFIASLQFQAATFGKTDAQVLQYKADLLGAGDAARPLIAQIEAMSAAAGGAAGSLRGATGEAHGLSFATAGAKRELLVLAHELSQGNFSKFGGSLLVLGERTGAAALLFNPLTLGILAAGGALAVLAYQVHKGHEDWTALGDAIKATGDYTGYTQRQIDQMSTYFARSAVEIQTGREALVALIATGRFTGDQLQLAGRAALDMASDTGKSIEDVSKELAKLPDGARKWAEEYQKTNHVFTAGNIELIDSLDKQGKQAEATTAVLNALDESHKRVADTMRKDKGTWDRFWDDWESGLQRIKNGLRDLGRPSTNFDEINKALEAREGLLSALKTNQDRLNGSGGKDPHLKDQVADISAAIAVNLSLIASLRAVGDAKTEAAKKNAELAKGGDAKIAVDKYLENGTKSDSTKHKEAIEKENKEFTEATANLSKNSKDYEVVLKHHKENLLQIDKDYQGKAAKDDPTQAYLLASLKEMEGLVAQEKALFKNREQEISRAVAGEYTTLAEGLKEKRQAIADDYAETQALYAREAAAVNERKAKLNSGTEKKAIAEQEKLLAEIEAKRALAAQASAIAMVQATGDQLKIQTDFNRATDDWVRQQGLANDAQQFSIDLMGKSALEVAQLTAAKKTQLDVEERIRLLKKKDPGADTSGIIAARDAQIATNNVLLASRDAKMKDPWFNATESIRKYGEEASNVGAQIGSTLTNAFKGAEDALVTFVTTGKLSFSSMANSIIADLVRIQARKAIAGLVDMAIGAFTGGAIAQPVTGGGSMEGDGYLAITGKATGGPVDAGNLYRVNEAGPELFSSGGYDYLMMGKQGGTITPTDKLGAAMSPSTGGGGAGVSMTTVINVSSNGSSSETSGSSSAQGRALADMVNTKVKEVLMRETRQGGILWNQNARGAR